MILRHFIFVFALGSHLWTHKLLSEKKKKKEKKKKQFNNI